MLFLVKEILDDKNFLDVKEDILGKNDFEGDRNVNFLCILGQKILEVLNVLEDNKNNVNLKKVSVFKGMNIGILVNFDIYGNLLIDTKVNGKLHLVQKEVF